VFLKVSFRDPRELGLKNRERRPPRELAGGVRFALFDVTATEQPALYSHGRGPRFDPLCAHQKHNKINNLFVYLPPSVPGKSRGTAGAQTRTDV
jgi:hypothetical protein